MQEWTKYDATRIWTGGDFTEAPETRGQVHSSHSHRPMHMSSGSPSAHATRSVPSNQCK